MTAVYGNWDRLIAAVLRREENREAALRTPSDLSSASTSSFSSSNSKSDGRVSSFSSSSLLVGKSFTYNQILQATDSFSDSKLIKRGHSGDLCSGTLQSGVQVVVKKVKVSSLEKELSLMSELEIFGMVNHSRLVPLLGHCLDKNADEKFLVYKHMNHEDLSKYLSGKLYIDWTTRLKIATGVAEGLCYLHHECFPPVVHRDIQASSILLDDDFEVRLGSLSGACVEGKYNKNRILRGSGSSEQRKYGISNATCASDVYSFGKVLLELVSGKLGICAANDSTMKDQVANTLHYIVPDKKLIAHIIDPSFGWDILVEAWAVAFIAKACLSPKASKRPTMASIVKALEHINFARLYGISGGRITSHNHELLVMRTVAVSPKGEILPHHNLKIFTFSELKEATNNFDMKSWLGQDEFGRVYQGLLLDKSMPQNGTSIAVRRMNLKSEKGFNQWQAELDMLGRISHPNIQKPIGYCWEVVELLLVYKFMQEGSLKRYLFKEGSATQLLSWESRLKISLGAARGLEFLHALERRGLCHQKKLGGGFYGYFNCSKILVDSDYTGKITGFSVAEINPPKILPDVVVITSSEDEYAAPEYKEGGNSLLESDVYGFGAVLFLMLTAREWYNFEYDFRELQALNFIENYMDWLIKAIENEPFKFLENYMDPQLKGKVPSEAAVRILLLAKLCLRQDHELRPSMQQVVQILEDIETIPKLG